MFVSGVAIHHHTDLEEGHEAVETAAYFPVFASTPCGAGFTPNYEGSDDYQGVPLLMLKGRNDSGRSFALAGTTLRINIIPSHD